MKTLTSLVWKAEFEARIFVSLTIVIAVCILSFLVFPGRNSNIVTAGLAVGFSQDTAETIGYAFAALLALVASLLRMWAGSVLSSHRVMAFNIQTDALMTKGPYVLVRNPIYLADFIALCGFTLVLPPAGFLLPVMFYLHYTALIHYEERCLGARFADRYSRYFKNVPRFFPDLTSVTDFLHSFHQFEINRDGMRHNALFVLFVLGLIVAAMTHRFLYAIVIGLPAVVDWAIVHTLIGTRKRPTAAASATEGETDVRSSSKKVFDDILYSQCWEDPENDRTAFQISPDDVLFSITSGGCNVLTFLLDNPRKIIALDLNPAQNYLLELKIAAFKTLSHGELLELMGVRDSRSRLDLYAKLRPVLRPESRAYWDGQKEKVDTGILNCGKYERYMGMLRTWITRLMGRSLVEEFFATEDSQARSNLYSRKWQNIRWWLFTRGLLSRTTMSLLFDKAFFRYLDSSLDFGKHFAAKARRALTELPMRENYFLAYILLGRFYDERHLPHYLRPENFETIRERVNRVEMVSDSCEHFFSSMPDNAITKFNFTNIFEWMSPAAFESLLKETIRVACDGATLTYRNLLVFRERPESLAQFIHSQHSLSQILHARDLSFIYNNYVVEQIRKG